MSRIEAQAEIPRLTHFYHRYGAGYLYPRPAPALLTSAMRSHIVLIEDEASELAGAACLFQHPLGPFETEPDFDSIDPAQTSVPHYLEFGGDLVRPDCNGWQLHLDLIALRTMLVLMEPPEDTAYAICEVKPPPSPNHSYANYCKSEFSDYPQVGSILEAAMYNSITPDDFPERYKCVSMPESLEALRICGRRALNLLSNSERARTRDGARARITGQSLTVTSPLFADIARSLAAA